MILRGDCGVALAVPCGRLLLLGLLVAAGCQPLPQPFAHNGSFDKDLLALPDHSGIVVLPVSNAPEPTASALAEAVAASLRDANVPASTEGGNRRSAFLLGRVEDDGFAARIVWELVDSAGAVIGGRIQSIDDVPMAAWRAADAVLLAKLSDGIGPELASLVQAVQPVERIGLLVSVLVVEGAPGDGDKSLGSALRQAMAEAGVGVREIAGVATIRGRISLIPAGPGQEEVRISWTVLGSDGRELGVVAQANVVPTGSLDGSWGRVARDVAVAAVPGLLELLAPAAGLGDRFTDADPLAKPQRPE